MSQLPTISSFYSDPSHELPSSFKSAGISYLNLINKPVTPPIELRNSVS